MEILHYLKHNWFQVIIDSIAALNVIVAGAKAMGWTKLADECQKIENAIQTMVKAALNQKGS